MRNIKLLVGALTAAALVLPTTARADLVIDTFSLPNPSAQYFGPVSANPFSNAVVSPTVLGGSRSYTATQVMGATFALGNAGAIGTDAALLSADKGALQFFSGTIPVEGVLKYPAMGSFAPTDLTGFGDSFQFDFQFTDGGIGPGAGELLETKIEVFTTGGTLTTLANFADSVGPVSFVVPFASFSGTGSFTSVTGLQITLNDPDPQTDFQLDQISVPIPEPASLVVWGLLGAGAVWYGRRRLKSKPAAA
jgi:hypothetical protein